MCVLLYSANEDKCETQHSGTPCFSSLAMSKNDASDGLPAAEAPAKRPPLNKYALACAVLASMNSILLGYGTYTHPCARLISLITTTKKCAACLCTYRYGLRTCLQTSL